jgi:Fe-S oxidoreductase
MQIFAIVVSLAFTAVGLTLFIRMIAQIVRVIRTGQPTHRTDSLGSRILNAAKEILLHTRMLQWTKVGVAHWFIMVGFGLLFFTLVNAYGQLFDPHFILPVIGHFPPFEWVTELFAWAMLVAIVPFMIYRATRPKQRVRGEAGRFYGSTMWQGYFVEWVILIVGICILTLRFFEFGLQDASGHHHYTNALHFPLTSFIGGQFSGRSVSTLENLIWIVATVKIVVSMTWMIVLGLNATMGVAWHRFSAPFNVLFKRESSGGTALGAVKPLMSEGKAVTLDDIDDLDEDATLGVGAIEDFSWKGILDFTSCTECGRCQSQCPAWNTEKPLSPKLLITALRDHAYAKAPFNQAGSEEARADLPADVLAEAQRPLIGTASAYGVIDPDVLWSCTSCGACVQQCPVDIEHVDHIIDMRRYQVLVESNFPTELNALFKGLENKGNPWNMSPTSRLDWAKDLPFEVKVVGDSIDSLDEVDWLFWVGCAGAYEDRAKKTTRAVAELLDLAGISFGVLGNGETCTGDPARRAGNEFVFQGLAQQNVEAFKEHRVKKVVSTCAHCFNTLKNEYKHFGIELEVVHHTQLLNRLVREGRLTPVSSGEGAARRSITYHDPCYLGRHNQVYSPPRELLQVLPGATIVEMERNSERSFCCGAGGARMWMEESIGERINLNRTTEAVETGADQIAVGCPFCRVMLSDGLTSKQAAGEAREEVEVLDIAQMLLASVKGEVATRVRKPAPAAKAVVATPAEETPTPVAAEPASSGSSLFDAPADKPAEEAPPASSGGSLFDGAPAEPAGSTSSLFDEPAVRTEPAQAPSSAGSLFDMPATEPATKPEPAPATGGSLFDMPATEPPTKPEPVAQVETTTEAEPEPEAPVRSLFDIRAETQAEAEPEAAAAEPEAEDQPKNEPGSLFDF